MKECVYHKRWGGRFRRFFCFSHIWWSDKLYKHNGITVEKSKCIECGRKEILILVEWR